MDLRYALLADFANVTGDGKLNIVGVCDRIYSVSFPALHRQLFLVTSIETGPEDDGQSRNIKIQMINADGHVLTQLDGQVTFAAGKQIFHQIHMFNDLRFEQPGPYQFNIFFDGKPVKTLDLELELVQQPS